MQSQGVQITQGRMKKLFEAAVRYHPSIDRVIKGTSFTSCKEWYGKISKELQVQASYAQQMERDGQREAGRGMGRGQQPMTTTGTRGGRGHQAPSTFRSFSTLTPRSQGAQQQQSAHNFTGRGGSSAGRAQGNAMMAWDGSSGTWQQTAVANAMEPMTAFRGRGARGRGDRGGGRGRASSEPPYGRQSFSPQGRGDRNGMAEAERYGNRAPINDPKHETESALSKGPYWHITGDLLKCRSATCGQPFDATVFCQGCGWEGHSRPWCYKANEPGFNPTGYYSVNRPGKGPLPGKKGEFRPRQVQFNLMDATPAAGQNQGGNNPRTDTA